MASDRNPGGPPPDRRRRPKPLPPEQKTRQQLLDTHLSEVGLTVRVVNALEHAEVYTVGGLAAVELETLQAVGSFGEVTIGEIHDLLTKLGLRPQWPRPRKKKPTK